MARWKIPRWFVGTLWRCNPRCKCRSSWPLYKYQCRKCYCRTTRYRCLWHNIRHTNGFWDHFGDVKRQTGDPGAFTDIALASVNGELQVSGVTNDGGLWHTIRHIDGSWDQFGDVNGQAGNPGTITNVASAYVQLLQV